MDAPETRDSQLNTAHLKLKKIAEAVENDDVSNFKVWYSSKEDLLTWRF